MSAETAFLRRLFMAALHAADPRIVLPPALPNKPLGRCVVVGAGKSAALMAQVVDQAWPDVRLSGVVVTRYGHAVPAGRITVLQAGHPVPDPASEAAARHILKAVQGLTANDLVLALISGGGSAVMALPAPGLTLADKQAITRTLLTSGATIADINAVRRHLSGIKGGRLGAACAPAHLVTLAISDVPGDDPALIASGPTVPPHGATDVSAILARHGITLPATARPLPAVPAVPTDYRLIATPALALCRAADLARAEGITPLILGDALQGEARDLGRALANDALSCGGPTVLLSGGETTVTIGDNPPGRGGRNTECLLAMACHLNGAPHIWALACDTDGIDGTEDAAGAVITPTTLARARNAAMDARACLDRHDSYSMFQAIGDLVVTGPTLTNVNDFRAVLVREGVLF